MDVSPAASTDVSQGRWHSAHYHQSSAIGPRSRPEEGSVSRQLDWFRTNLDTSKRDVVRLVGAPLHAVATENAWGRSLSTSVSETDITDATSPLSDVLFGSRTGPRGLRNGFDVEDADVERSTMTPTAGLPSC